MQAEMDFNTVQKGIRSGDFTLIDVRNVNEVQTAGKIPSSHLIPRKYSYLLNKHAGTLINFRKVFVPTRSLFRAPRLLISTFFQANTHH